MAVRLPRLYREYAEWFHLLTSPEEYSEEASVYTAILEDSVRPSPQTVLELGSGGGNNASHMKAHFTLTLTDVSPQMLAISKSINPECEHVEGDMRTLRLGRSFDAVFAHDSLDYLTKVDDLVRTIHTAWIHCRPGGVVLLIPDCVRETFKPRTEHGGHDGESRGLRYLEWSWDPEPADSIYSSEMVYLMRGANGAIRVEHERHVLGLFGRAEWLRAMTDAGFEARSVACSLGDDEPTSVEAFVGLRPAE